MDKITQTSLIIRKETKFDKIRKRLFMLFFGQEYTLLQEIEDLLIPRREKKKNIVIPNEIGKKIEKIGKENEK